MAARRVVKPLRRLMTDRTTIVITGTAELRMPLFTEGLAEALAVVVRPAYGHQGHESPEWQEGYGSYEAWQAPSYAYDQYVPAPVSTTLPDGRPLFREEEPWPGT